MFSVSGVKGRCTVIISHLSDIQEGNLLWTKVSPVIQNDRINFIKWLIIKYSYCLDVEIDSDIEYQEYQNKYLKKCKI